MFPPGYAYYTATVISKEEGCGPFDVVTNDTIGNSQAVRALAHEKFPDAGFDTGEVVWVESDETPPDGMLERCWVNYYAAQVRS